MHKLIRLFLCAGSVLLAQQAMAQSAASPTASQPAAKAAPKAVKQTVKQTVKPTAKAPAKPAARAKAAAPVEPVAAGDDEDDSIPDTTMATVTDYNCDHGQKVSLFFNAGDADNPAMRWQKHLLRMKRVTTTTGADRFENKRVGLIWIGIPAKGMLLDSKKGQQLANECKTAQQMLSLAK